MHLYLHQFSYYIFFSSRRRHTRYIGDWSSDVCSSDLGFVGNMMRVPALFSRRIDRQRGIDTHRVREVTIRSSEPMLFHVDGEAAQGSDTLIARVHPGALRLR